MLCAMSTTRRELLRLVGAGVTGLAMGCELREAGPALPAVATAVLDPDSAGFVVAIWTRRPVREATLAIAAPAAPVRTETVRLIGGLGAAEITGLAADTRHEVTVTIDGERAAVHRVRTAPRPDDPRPVRIAVGADVDPSPRFASGLFDALVAEDPELYVSIGDFPYADNGPPAHTLDEYRARHVEVRAHPPVRRLLEACGMAAIYDDHELANNWDRALEELEPRRFAAAMQAWDEFFPLRTPGDIKYRRWRWGAHLECFLLDCRRFRSANADPDDARKTMLGAVQRGWLIDGVTRSTATFKLILTSVPLDYGVGDDHWAAFATERDAVFAALVGVPGVVFVSGDQHWFAAQRHAHGIREFQIGPLARSIGVPGPRAPGVVFRAERYNAGLVEIDGDQLTISGLGEDGDRFYRETLTAADLTPAAGSAALSPRPAPRAR
jgi:alkaline phosphatase D